jgi:dethiobiotin synthetase
MPVLLIARNALGTVNHTALALAEIRRRNLPFLGLILVDTTGADSHDPSANADLIADLTGVRALGVLPHIPSPTPILLAQELDRSVDLLTLWTRLLT